MVAHKGAGGKSVFLLDTVRPELWHDQIDVVIRAIGSWKMVISEKRLVGSLV